MSMDVCGRNPSDRDGEYFQCSIWTWRPIWDLIGKLCHDFIDEKMLVEMAYNDGSGPANQKVCDKMATRFEQWMEQHTNGHEVDFGCQSPFNELDEALKGFLGGIVEQPDRAINLDEDEPIMMTVSSDEENGPQIKPLTSAHNISDSKLKEWVRFLHTCGGFQVC